MTLQKQHGASCWMKQRGYAGSWSSPNRRLQNYKEQNEAVSLEETQNITVEKLKELNLRVTTAKTERLKLESDYAETTNRNYRSPEELLNIPAIANTSADSRP